MHDDSHGQPPNEVQRANIEEFHILMDGVSELDKKSTLRWVQRIGIPMSSRNWLPAALAARVALEIRKESQNMSASAQKISQEVTATDDRIREHLSSIRGEIASSACKVKSQLDDAADRFSNITADTIHALGPTMNRKSEELVTQAAAKIASQATAKVSIMLHGYMRREVIIVATLALLLAFAAGFAFSENLHAGAKLTGSAHQRR